MRLWWKTDFLTQVSSPPGRGGPRGQLPTHRDRSATARLKFSSAKLFPRIHCLFCLFFSFATLAVGLVRATSGNGRSRSAKTLKKHIAIPRYCKDGIFLGTELFALMLFSFREAFNSLFLEPSLGWSEAAELFMDATSNRAGRKSLLCSLLAWVTFERLLVRLGRRLQWAGNHYTKPSVLHGALQPPPLLATSSTSHPLTSGEGMMSGFFFKEGDAFFFTSEEEETMPFDLGWLVVFQSIFMDGAIKKKRIVQKCDKIK